MPNPTEVLIHDIDEASKKHLQTALTYKDKKVEYEYQKFKHASWYANKYGAEAFTERLKELKDGRVKNLLQERDDELYTYSGLVPLLRENLPFPDVTKQFSYPEAKLIPWDHKPEHEARDYQVKATSLLLQGRHAAVEIGTGLGKSRIIMQLLKELGLQAVVMAPSKSIARQLFKDFTHAFGKKYVGLYGDGKKDFKKLFTIGISASLTRIKEGSVEWNTLSKAPVFIADESHQCPAATLATVCFGLMKNAPYRFFFSGTQMRNDGLDLLLEGITGHIVFTMTVKEGVDRGFLARPHFRMVNLQSDSPFFSKDAMEMTRQHLYYNGKVNATCGMLANRMVGAMQKPTLILVEEMEQFAHLLPHLKHEVKFAHGGVTKENAEKVPEEFHESDPEELVDQFNQGKIPILVGTSCVTTGTDFRPLGALFYLQGGKSEIQVKQACGRGTRGGSNSKVVFPWTGEQKTEFFYWDFNVNNIQTTERHAEERKKIYDDIYPGLQELNL